MAALQYLESLKNLHLELGEWYNSLADLYQKKLWHQLTLKLEQFIALTVFQAVDALIQLYNNFITDFKTKINLLKLAHFVVVILRHYPEKEAANQRRFRFTVADPSYRGFFERDFWDYM